MGIKPKQAAFDGFGGDEADLSLFFALLPSAEASRAAFALGTDLKEQYSLKGHAMPMARQHVTLHKLGEFSGLIPAGLIKQAIAAGARLEAAAFTLMFDEVMNFGNLADPAVVLAGGNAAEAIQPLWEALRYSLAREFLQSQPKLGTPHMTLIYGSSKIERQPVKPIQWQIAELVLIKSLIGKSQHEYMGRWPLMAPSAP